VTFSFPVYIIRITDSSLRSVRDLQYSVTYFLTKEIYYVNALDDVVRYNYYKIKS